jgi:hypothetical protein
MGSLIMRKAVAAEAAAVKCRKDRRENRGMGISKGMEFIGLKMQLLGGKITRVIVGLQQFHGWRFQGWLDSSFARNSPSETPVEM